MQSAQDEQRALVDEEGIAAAVDDELARETAVAQRAVTTERRREPIRRPEAGEQRERRRNLRHRRRMNGPRLSLGDEHRPVPGDGVHTLVGADDGGELLERRLRRCARAQAEEERQRACATQHRSHVRVLCANRRQSVNVAGSNVCDLRSNRPSVALRQER